VGCAIAVLSVSVGVIGVLESIHHWHLENVQAYLGLAFGGGTVGLIISIFGRTGEDQDSPSDSLRRCQHCGSHVVGKAKTCRNCGADVK
jgi:hypothetical protein